jgi:hypothetical protein
MRAEGHPWWNLAKRNADWTGTSAQRYGDFGQWATFLYQVTGDRTYADKALGVLRQEFANTAPKGANFTREWGAEYVVLYDWLYPAMSVSDRAAFVAMLNRWADEATTNRWAPSFPIRTEDTDQTTGNFFQFAFMALATAEDNPRASEFLNRSYVGGLTPTGLDRKTLRNAIRQYCVEMATGGQWMEGAQYNMGTLKLLAMGAEGVRTATGVNHFPEVSQVLPRLGLGQVYEVTGDLKASYQWGDEEHARDLNLWKRMGVLGMLGGLLQNDSSVGPYLNYLVDAFTDKYGYTGWLSAEPHSRLLYFYNPYAPTADYRALPSHFQASGQGVQFYRDGWGASDSLFGLHFPRVQPVTDHEVKYFGDFQLYRRGEWVITHPMGYAGPPNGGEGTNAMLLAGLSSMEAVKGTVATEADRNGRYLYSAGTTSGQYYRLPYFSPPRPFLNEWTRSFLHLPSQDKRSDTTVIYDRVNAGPVLDLDRYRTADRAMIQAAPARKQWILHMPIAPTVTADAISWSTSLGQQAKVSTLLPAGQRRQVIDEDATWSDSYPNPEKSEQKWQVRIMPATDQQWDTFLNVVQAYDAGTSLTNTLVRSTGGEAEGALIRRGGHPDALVMFGAAPTGRVRTTGYQFQWTASASTTELYLADLQPGRPWAVRIDGGAPRPLSTSSQGMGRITVPGAGSHTAMLVLPATG